MGGPVAIEIHELARMLDQQARSLAPQLLPNGRQLGAWWRTGSIGDEPGEEPGGQPAGSADRHVDRFRRRRGHARAIGRHA